MCMRRWSKAARDEAGPTSPTKSMRKEFGSNCGEDACEFSLSISFVRRTKRAPLSVAKYRAGEWKCAEASVHAVGAPLRLPKERVMCGDDGRD